jgi:hypothetical protein
MKKTNQLGAAAQSIDEKATQNNFQTQRNCRGGLLRAGMHVFIPLAPAPCLSVELS